MLSFDGKQFKLHANRSDLATRYFHDTVVEAKGRAYVGNFGFDLHNVA